MTINFLTYRAAARQVRRSWVRGTYRGDNNSVCLVQSVLDQAGILDTELPEQMVAEIDASLARYTSYRFIKSVALYADVSVQDAIMAWNDFAGTQRRVAKALDEVADAQELEYLRAEQLRLQIEVQRLTTKVDDLASQTAFLKERIAELESENGWLRRLTNSAALAADRRVLAQLDNELQTYCDALTQKQEVLTSDKFARLTV